MAVNVDKIKKASVFHSCREVLLEMAEQVNTLSELVKKQADEIKRLKPKS